MFAGNVFGCGSSPLCLNATFGVHCSRVVSALMACLEIILFFALHVKFTPGGLVIDAVSIGSIGSCEYTTCWITGAILVIIGTAPGVLFRVRRLCVRGVFLRWRFAVGFRDCIMGGASVILGIVMIGESSITLCCRSCSASLTLCSSSFAVAGSNILTILVCRFLMHARPCGVVAAIFVSSASSSVKARRCCMLVRFGSWQCCGYTSVDPEILYARVSGM